MRQFNYFYSSYIKNKHGFFTFIPHANLFHPYFGLATIGFNGEFPPYLKYVNFFNKKTFGFTHKVKLFFPEIREGLIYIDKIKYSIDSNPIDEVDITYQVVKNSKYYDYVQIVNHIAEFDIEIFVNTKFSGIWYPITISCDYVDVLLYQQRISITETQSSIKLIPYLSAHHTDAPLYYLNTGVDAIVNMRNTLLTYDVILTPESASEIAKYGFKATEFLSKMTLDEDNLVKVYIATLESFILKYAIEPNAESLNNYPNLFINSPEKLNIDYMPMINNMWFLNDTATCDVKAQSYWYTTVYDKNWTSQDLPKSKCKQKATYSANETRGYVWYKIFHNYHLDEKTLNNLTQETLGDIPKQFGLFELYKKDR